MTLSPLPIPDFKPARVLVVGDVMLDRYWYGDTSRISPEAPVPVVHVNKIEERPGGAANVALNIAALNGQVSLLSVVGKDEAGQILNDQLHAANVDCHLEISAQVPTVTKLRVLSQHQQLIRLDFEQPQHATVLTKMNKYYQQQLSRCQAVVLSDYHKGALHNISEFIQQAVAAQVPVFIDPKSTD